MIFFRWSQILEVFPITFLRFSIIGFSSFYSTAFLLFVKKVP